MPDRNPYFAKYMKSRYHKRRAIVLEKLGGKCAKCPSTTRLEIDHINRTKKSFPISKFWSCSESKLAPELAKCQLLCKTHHVEKTIVDLGQKPAKGTHGTLSSSKYCKCVLCKKAKLDWNREYRQKIKSA